MNLQKTGYPPKIDWKTKSKPTATLKEFKQFLVLHMSG